MSVILHKTLGLNPRIIKVACFICGKIKDDSITLLEIKNYLDTCDKCGMQHIGGVPTE